MKASEVAAKYGIFEFEVKKYIKEHAYFPIKENIWGDIAIPDDVDIENFFAPMLKLKQLSPEEKKQYRQKLFQEAIDKKDQIIQEKENLERKQREEQHHLSLERLKANNIEGYYEYKVLSLLDIGGLFNVNSGRVDVNKMTLTLNELGIDGWHLVTAYSNELGKKALSGGVGGAILGTNSTVDENILIFERFVKIQ